MSTAANIKNEANRAAYSPAMEMLTRLGFGVRGLLYIIMGYLTYKVATGKGGQLGSPQNALATIGHSPFGKTLLWIMVVGLAAYGLWGVIRAALDSEGKGKDTKGAIARLGYFISGVSYGFLAWTAYSILKGTGGGSTGGQGKWLAGIMSKTWGIWLVAIIGLIVIGAGLYKIFSAFKRGFEKQYNAYTLNAQQQRTVTMLGRIGTAAQGVVLALVGALIFYAAYTSNPSQPIGFEAALGTLLSKPFGPGLVLLVALGLVAFGIYSLLGAFWFHMRRAPRSY